MKEPKWADEIKEAILELGGVASLEDIYLQITRRNIKKQTPNWKDTVRDAIQQHSSDSKSYRGSNNYFYSVYGKGRGVWGVREIVSLEIKGNVKQIFEGEKEIKLEKLIQEGTNEEIEKLIDDYNNLEIKAKIEVKEGLKKIRKASKIVTNKLKELYDQSCQICGVNPGLDHNVNIVEAHHIEYFSISQNHSPDNIMILCPNHHRLFHTAKAEYDKENNEIIYRNGHREKLLLDKHLMKKTKFLV